MVSESPGQGEAAPRGRDREAQAVGPTTALPELRLGGRPRVPSAGRGGLDAPVHRCRHGQELAGGRCHGEEQPSGSRGRGHVHAAAVASALARTASSGAAPALPDLSESSRTVASSNCSTERKLRRTKAPNF
uniref:Uncharacterized protein n=1 Tax=Trichogramma kaykai TaxID=54128 RepID=A0ABD2XJ03_9HYME